MWTRRRRVSTAQPWPAVLKKGQTQKNAPSHKADMCPLTHTLPFIDYSAPATISRISVVLSMSLFNCAFFFPKRLLHLLLSIFPLQWFSSSAVSNMWKGCFSWLLFCVNRQSALAVFPSVSLHRFQKWMLLCHSKSCKHSDQTSVKFDMFLKNPALLCFRGILKSALLDLQ